MGIFFNKSVKNQGLDVVVTDSTLEEFEIILLRGLQGKLGFSGMLDNTTPVENDSTFLYLLDSFVNNFNENTSYEIELQGYSDGTLTFNELTYDFLEVKVRVLTK